jgi:hypothetical protein
MTIGQGGLHERLSKDTWRKEKGEWRREKGEWRKENETV